MAVFIRPAQSSDISSMLHIAHRSIDEVCRYDYRENVDLLNQWMAGKTLARANYWVSNPDCFTLLAEDETGNSAGFAVMQRDGELNQLHVLPEYLGQGFGKAILNHVEHTASFAGLVSLSTFSTLTSLAFYLSQGFESAGKPIVPKDGIEGEYPLSKKLLSGKR